LPLPDGNLWFTESEASRVGRITLAGVVTEFPTPEAFSYPLGIATGPDGNLWFSQYSANRIGRITTAGDIGESGPKRGVGPTGMATGPEATCGSPRTVPETASPSTGSRETVLQPIPDDLAPPRQWRIPCLVDRRTL
jgi:virginiamycin B lyase